MGNNSVSTATWVKDVCTFAISDTGLSTVNVLEKDGNSSMGLCLKFMTHS